MWVVLSGKEDQRKPEEARLELGFEGGVRNLGPCGTAVKLDPNESNWMGLLLSPCSVWLVVSFLLY